MQNIQWCILKINKKEECLRNKKQLIKNIIALILIITGFLLVFTGAIIQIILAIQIYGLFGSFYVPHWSLYLYIGVVPALIGMAISEE